MTTWILFISAVFTPVLEPLGLSVPAFEPAPDPVEVIETVEPDMRVEMPARSVLQDMRHPGIERMFARLEAGE